MESASRNTDRRIGRTRQLLRQASIELMQEKGFQALSVQELAERANVSRGTFYAHFEDKYALLESLLREQFQGLVSPLPPVSHWNKNTLQHFIRLPLEHFRDVQRRCHPLGVVDPLIERLFQEEVATLLLEWLKHKRREASREIVPLLTLARTMSWAIIGTALQWSLEPTTASDQMAHDLTLTLLEGVERLVP